MAFRRIRHSFFYKNRDRTKATFADSLFSGTVYLTLEVQSDGSVSGKYKASTGGSGTVVGKLEGHTFYFTLTQTVEGCPGSYSGSLNFQGEQGAGSYTGSDCLGQHESGVVSMARASQEEVAALESPEILPVGNIYVQGRRYWVSKSDKYLLLLSAEQTKDYLLLHIGLQNDSTDFVTFDPERIFVQDLLEAKPLRYYTPQEIANKIRRRAGWSTFLRALAAGMQAFGQSGPTTSYSYGSFNASDQYGNFVYGTYSGVTTVYSPPDTSEIQRRSAEDIAAIRQTAEAKSAQIQQGSAYAHTLAPKSYILGYVYFSKAKQKNLRNLLGVNRKNFLVYVLVPLGEQTFRFAFPMKVLEEVLQQRR